MKHAFDRHTKDELAYLARQDFVRDLMLKIWWPRTDRQRIAFKICLYAGTLVLITAQMLLACAIASAIAYGIGALSRI